MSGLCKHGDEHSGSITGDCIHKQNKTIPDYEDRTQWN